jgi:hypothetical protein
MNHTDHSSNASSLTLDSVQHGRIRKNEYEKQFLLQHHILMTIFTKKVSNSIALVFYGDGTQM